MVSECRNRTAEPSGTLALLASQGWRWSVPSARPWNERNARLKIRLRPFTGISDRAPLEVTRADDRPDSSYRWAVFSRKWLDLVGHRRRKIASHRLSHGEKSESSRACERVGQSKSRREFWFRVPWDTYQTTRAGQRFGDAALKVGQDSALLGFVYGTRLG